MLKTFESNTLINVPIKKTEFLNTAFNVLKCNDPILVVVSSMAKLSFIRKHNDLEFRHSFLVYGLDNEKELAYIGESCLKDRGGELLSFKATIPLQELINCTQLYAWLELKNNPTIHRKDIIKIIIKDFERFLIGIKEGSMCYGYLSLKEYINNLNKLQYLDNESFNSACIETYYNLQLLVIPIFKSILALIIEYPEFQTDNYQSMVQKNMNLIDEWKKVCLMILKVGKLMQKNKITEIVQFCKKIILMQEIEYNNLLSHMLHS